MVISWFEWLQGGYTGEGIVCRKDTLKYSRVVGHQILKQHQGKKALQGTGGLFCRLEIIVLKTLMQAVVQAATNGGSEKKWSDSGYILQVGTTGFPTGMNLGMREGKESKVTAQFLS